MHPMTQHYDWVRYGLITTSNAATHSGRASQWLTQRAIPVGTPHTEFSAALTNLSTYNTDAVDLSEQPINNLYNSYLRTSTAGDNTDDDGEWFH